MGKNMFHLLQSIINSDNETETNKLIACYLIENLQEIENLSIYDLADGCFTSNSTISRFAKSLGANNFIEMKGNLSAYKDYGLELSTESLEYLHFDKKNNAKILTNYIDNICDSLRVMEDINFEEIKELNRIIHETKNTAIFGTQLTGLFAKHYQLMMMSMGKVIQCCDDGANHLETANAMGKDDLAIILSIDGNYIGGNKNVIFALKKRGVKMILITHNPTCKFLGQFDKVIYMGDYTNSKGGRYKLQLMMEIMVNLYAVEFYN